MDMDDMDINDGMDKKIRNMFLKRFINLNKIELGDGIY